MCLFRSVFALVVVLRYVFLIPPFICFLLVSFVIVYSVRSFVRYLFRSSFMYVCLYFFNSFLRYFFRLFSFVI